MPALDVNLDDARACFETNFFAVVALTQSFVPLLIAARGLILNIGSVAAVVPYVFGSVYNASKAALHSWSETLRLEVAPFGLRVLLVVTGGVKSRIARTDRALPPGSLYVDIDAEYQRRVKHSQEGAMATDDYARGVVREALKGWAQKKAYWRGNMSGLIWLVQTCLGTWLFDLLLPRMFGLRRLAKLVRGRGDRVGDGRDFG